MYIYMHPGYLRSYEAFSYTGKIDLRIEMLFLRISVICRAYGMKDQSYYASIQVSFRTNFGLRRGWQEMRVTFDLSLTNMTLEGKLLNQYIKKS